MHYHSRRNLHLLVLVISLIAVYVPTFSGEFILDDIPFVKNNPAVAGVRPLASYFLQEDGIVGDQEGRIHSGYYRPLVNLTYRMDYLLWASNSAGFRTTNLVLHLITCLLLYLCMGRVLGKSEAFWLAVLLFGLHPVNTEAVAWVSSRNNILVTLFSLASFYLYARREEEQQSWHRMLSLLFFALALLSKEFAVMLLPIFVVYDRVVRGEKGFFRKRVWGYIAFLSVLAGYAALRKAAVPDVVPIGHSIGGLWEAVWFSPYLLLENLRVILIPVGLHSFMIGYPGSFLSSEAVLGFAFLALLLFLLWKWKAQRVFLFSIFSFLLALFPVLNILPTSAFSLVSMRWLYFPMTFLTFSAAWVIGRTKGPGKDFLHWTLVSAAALYLGCYTYVLNENHWKKEEDFFRTEVAVFGNNFYAGDLARIHYLRGEHREANALYRRAMESRTPSRARLLINYAALLIDSNRPEIALGYLDEAEKLGPGGEDRGILWNNRGVALFRAEDYRGAMVCFEKAVAFAPGEHSYRANLGQAAMKARDHAKQAMGK